MPCGVEVTVVFLAGPVVVCGAAVATVDALWWGPWVRVLAYTGPSVNAWAARAVSSS